LAYEVFEQWRSLLIIKLLKYLINVLLPLFFAAGWSTSSPLAEAHLPYLHLYPDVSIPPKYPYPRPPFALTFL
jgi:hypothetical protein